MSTSLDALKRRIDKLDTSMSKPLRVVQVILEPDEPEPDMGLFDADLVIIRKLCTP